MSNFQAGLLPNKRDGISEITFCFPSMCMGVSGHAKWSLRHKDNVWTRCLTTREQFDVRHRTHLTVGELSVKSVMHFSRRSPLTHFFASQKMSRPTISRSEFVIVPLGFWKEIMFALMSSGHSQWNTIRVQAKLLPKIAPPTSWSDMSTIPMKSGHSYVSL